jgi:lactoylglutathione lyase
MELHRRHDFEDGEFSLAFIGYGDMPEIELTYNWGEDEPYEKGEGFGHIAIGVDDVEETCERLRDYGADIPREPGPMGDTGMIMAFVEDPDGYLIELLEDDTFPMNS